MGRPTYASVAAIILAGSAAALSCLPHDAAATFQRIDKAEEVHIAVHGTLAFDAALLSHTDWADQAATPRETRIPARLRGRALGQAGFTHPFDAQITLRVLCLGPWCAQPPAGAEVMAFVQKDAGGHVLTVDPCGGDAFFSPAPETLDIVQDCFAGGPCRPQHPSHQ